MERDPPQPMACPICRTPLTMSERQGIEIDYCPACRGVWLDRGELDKIIERSAGDVGGPTPAAPPAPGLAWGGDKRRRYEQDDRHYGRPKRRKSFLEELFD